MPYNQNPAGDPLAPVANNLPAGMGALGGAIGGGSALGAAAAAPVAIAGAGGAMLGNAIAPYVFGDMDQQGSSMQEVPENGFQPSTGNSAVDKAVNWAQGLF